jgi:medium-chain acyl-[acyl-carrier-protein] hydrolase
VPLLCLPYAGGRASAFRDWADELPATVRPIAVDYPRGGRGAAPDTVAAIAGRLLDALRAWPPQVPLALFGHSLGALVAYELALLLAGERRAPRLLFVSAHRAPHEAAREPPAHDLSSPELHAWLSRWGGVPRELREDAEVLALFEPALREDLRLAETWQPPEAAPLAGAVVALAGLGDALAPPESMAGWQRATRGSFRLHTLPGGHFFLHEQRQHLLSLLALEIERCGL